MMTNLPQMQQLLTIMAKLRNPDGGCPWDLEQNFATIAPYTLEEAYEVADAIERDDMLALKEELGDLLLQVVFHAQMAEEAGLFTFEEVAAGINDKMIRRHPHVELSNCPAIAPAGAHMGRSPNGSRSGLARPADLASAPIRTASDQTANWERLKAEEKKAKGHDSVMDDIPVALPALTRAQKLGSKATKKRCDWPSITPALEKVEEEVAELKEALQNNDHTHIEEELGDLLFAVVNIARHAKLDAETALRKANQKFEQRFRLIEPNLDACANLEEMDRLWDKAKETLRQHKASA